MNDDQVVVDGLIWRCERLYTFDEKKGRRISSNNPEIGKRCGLLVTDDPKIIAEGLYKKPFICDLCKLPKVPCNCMEGYYWHCLGYSKCSRRIKFEEKDTSALNIIDSKT